MANEGAETLFQSEEVPTRPGSPPRTATSRWRAVTSVALQRGFGRLTDEGLDRASAPAPEPVEAPRADESGSQPVVPTSPPSAVAAETPGGRASGPRETVRLSRSDRGPTGTVRIPRRTARVPSIAARTARRTWRSYVFFALVAGAQLVLLPLASPPDSPPAEATTPPAGSVASPTMAPASPPPEELVEPAEPVEPPAPAAAPETAPAKPARTLGRVRGHRAVHAGSNVL